MGPLTRTTLVATLAAGLLAGCAGPDRTALPEPSAGSGPAAVERPHFEGRLPVTLTQGRVVVGDDGCLADDAPEWVCDPTEEEPYLAFGDRWAADLVEARMDVAGGGTSWTVTVRLDRRGTASLLRLVARAGRSGALVLVLGEDGEVLLPVPVTKLDGRVISLSHLAKPEAWSLVERIAAQ